ncbi:MAG: NADH:flavin oxidoreductase [Acidimicrobiales bacterium]
MRYTQVKRLTTADALRAHLASLDVELAIDDEVEAHGPLAQPIAFTDIAAGPIELANRFAILPMEGWDGTTLGGATDLARRRWERFGASGAALVWGEATAVRPDGRANPNQLVISSDTIDDLAGLRGLLDPSQVAGLQLTHSGRFARPHGAPLPRTAYVHPVLDAGAGYGVAEEVARRVLTDSELDHLIADFVQAAVLASEAGFDFVDIKHCHGYLLHELLTAYDRPGRFGGDLDGRTRFLSTVVEGIRAAAPGLAVALRLSVFDLAPFRAGPDGRGEPATRGSYDRAFGGDGTGVGIDLTETHALLDRVEAMGIGLVCTTAGSPYYNPHVQRPAYFPPSDGYDPPEDPLVGVARQIAATAALKSRHPRLVFVGSGYSYLQQWLPHVAQAAVRYGGTDLVGLGRMALSHPDLPRRVISGEALDDRLICRTFSDCTTAPRNGLVSGCYPLDPFYKSRPERIELAAAKKAARNR